MRALAVIPARGGSKGIPRKNLRPVAGRSLVEWAIRAAREADILAIVSTDDDHIRCEALRFDAIAHQRSAELATDEALTDPVIMDVLVRFIADQDERPEYVVTLQPTVPVRRPGLVDECVHRAIDTGADSVMTAYPLHFVWWREEPDPTRTDLHGGWRCQCQRRPRRQDMEARELMWHEDGSVYVTRTESLLRTGARVCGKVEVVETERTPDIDTWEDLIMADALLRHREAIRDDQA